MRRIGSLAVLCLALASAVRAAEIHGTIRENGKPVPQGVALKVECAGATATAATDEYGFYSLKTTATGDCRLTLDYKGMSASLKVTLYEKPSRYDLVVKEEGGKLTLERK